MSSADDLADRLQRRYEAFAEYIATLGPDQWRTRCRNHPAIHIGEQEEGRPVGTVAHHVAASLDPTLQFVQAIVTGGEIPMPSHEANAAHARANPDPDRSETVSLVRSKSAQAAEVLRTLSDDDLAQTAQTFMGEISASQAVERVMIGHVDWHEGSIKATLGHPL